MYELRRLPLVVIGAALITFSGCARPPADDYRISLTVKDIMDAIVDPSSDAIWGSVEVVATLEGTVEKQPRTDDDWKALRRHAVTRHLMMVISNRTARKQ